MKKKSLFCLIRGALLIATIVSLLFICLGENSAPKAETSEYPLITHDLEGRDSCLQCHESAKGGAPEIPAEDHVGFTNDLCRDCHEAAK